LIAIANPVKAQDHLARLTWMLIFLKGLTSQGQLQKGINHLSSHLALDVKLTTQQWEADKNLQSVKAALTCMDMQQTLQLQAQLLDTGSHRLLLKLDLTGLEFQQREDLSMLTQIQTSLLESSSYIQTSTTGCTLKWVSH